MPPVCENAACRISSEDVAASVAAKSRSLQIFTDCSPAQLQTQSENAPPPIQIDIVIKSSPRHALFLAPLFASLRLFWPDYARLVVVVESPDEAWPLGMAPPRTSWVEEPLGAAGNDYLGQMFSSLFMDLYTTAPVLAMVESDVVLHAPVDRASLTVDDRLVMRYVRCRSSGDTLTGDGEFDHWEGWWGCTFDGIKFLLGANGGNFIMQAPFFFPRCALPAMRAHVEALHGRTFYEVMADIALRGVRISQHDAIGNFLLLFGGNSSCAAALDGSASAGGLRGVHFIKWGHEEMFPHVGRHVGYEASPAYGKKDREAYLTYAHTVIREGACRSFINVDPALCEKGYSNYEKVVSYQLSGPGPGHKGVHRYASALTPRCFLGS